MVLQGNAVVVQLSVLAPPGEAAEQVEAAALEVVEVALDGAWGDAGQLGDVGVGQPLALEPEDLHLLLHAGVGVVVAVAADLVEDVRAESETSHGGLPGTRGRLPPML